MHKSLSRRNFLQTSVSAGLGLGLMGNGALAMSCCSEPPFKISLAQWSLHKALFAKKLDPLDFAVVAREKFDIGAIEYVNQFYWGKPSDKAYMKELKMRAADNGVRSLLIMVDGEGNLGAADKKERKKVVENHYKWVDAAAYLGCHSIRVNAGGPGNRDELADAVVDGLGKLTHHAANSGINVIVENHGGLSSDGGWLSGIMARINHERCGTLPDFGNFCIKREQDADGNRVCVDEYDRYKGVAELMPYAKSVSAKTHDFDKEGNEIHTDYFRMMEIVLEAGYHGYVGIEYEGSQYDEYTGIRKSKALLERVIASYKA